MGISIGDQLWVARYLLQRVAEDFNVSISFAPKLFSEWNGSGCHTNYSTKTMRAGTGGMAYIDDMMAKFAAKHTEHIALYGDDNNKRLTGHHETSSLTKFSYGIGNRAASFRIPTSCAAANGAGYIEDRRPASNIDPYIVSAIVFDTSVLPETHADDLKAAYANWQVWRNSENLHNIAQ